MIYQNKILNLCSLTHKNYILCPNEVGRAQDPNRPHPHGSTCIGRRDAGGQTNVLCKTITRPSADGLDHGVGKPGCC